MKHSGETPSQPDWLERILGAVAAFIFFGLTTLLMPVIVVAQLVGGSPHVGYYHPSVYGSIIFYIWVVLVSISASVFGFAVGISRVIDALGYLWFTADPPDQERSMRYWAVLVIPGLITWIVAMAVKL